MRDVGRHAVTRSGRLNDPAVVRPFEFDDVVATYVVDGVMAVAPDAFFPEVPSGYWLSDPELCDDRGRVVMGAGGLLVERDGRALTVKKRRPPKGTGRSRDARTETSITAAHFARPMFCRNRFPVPQGTLHQFDNQRTRHSHQRCLPRVPNAGAGRVLRTVLSGLSAFGGCRNEPGGRRIRIRISVNLAVAAAV
jgi:hypothetical protein